MRARSGAHPGSPSSLAALAEQVCIGYAPPEVKMLLLLALACSDSKDTGFALGDVEDPGTPLDDTATDTGDSDTAADTAGDTSAEDTGTVDTGGEDTGPREDLRTFAFLQSTRTLVDSPVGGGTAPSDTRAVARLSWRRVGTDVTWDEELCSLESTEVHDTQTTFPAAFVASVPVSTRVATLSAAETGATFTAGPFTDVLGARLDNPESDRLPTRASDSRQWDQDGDGQPGMTVHVDQAFLGEGDVYVAQRTETTLEGVVVAADRIEGWVSLTQEQVIYDASTWWLELDTNQRPDTAREHNYFVFQQVEDATTCDDIVARQRSLF